MIVRRYEIFFDEIVCFLSDLDILDNHIIVEYVFCNLVAYYEL